MTAEFLLEVGTPPVRPDRVVLVLPAAEPTEAVLAALQRLQFSGYTIALDGYNAQLATVAKLVRIPVAGRTDEELQAAVAEAAGLELVATGVATPEDLTRCAALGFTTFQGEFFGRPDHTRQRRVGTGGISSLAALADRRGSRRELRGARARDRQRRRPLAQAPALRQLRLLRAPAHG